MGQHLRFQGKKPGSLGGRSNVRDARDIEEAARVMNQINARAKREAREKRAAEKKARDKAKITLPSIETLNKFMGRK